MSGESAGRIDLDLGINYGRFNRDLNGVAGNATNLVGGAFKKLGLVIAGAFAVGGMIHFGRTAIQLASDLNEVQNVVDVTFGSMSEHVNQFAKNALSSFGLSELSAKKFTSVMGAMLKSSGLTGQQMLMMSESLTGLSADFASFYNLKPEEAFDKIRAGISGETEPLKQLGINMSVANLEAYALSKGITKSWLSMSQAEQVLLRYNYLLNASKDAQGDFARTSNSWANQTRLLGEQWKIFQGTMGQGFINILTPVVRGLNTLIAKLQIAAQYFKAFTEMIFGAAKTTGTGQAAVASLGDTASTTGDSMGGLGGSLGDTADATKKANKAIKGSLSGFDQLNVIGKSAADALDGAAGGLGDIGAGGGIPDIAIPKATDLPAPDMTKFQPVIDFLDKVKILAQQAGTFLVNTFGPPFQSVLSSIMPPLTAWKTALYDTFNQVGGLGEPLKTWFTSDMIPFVQRQITVYGEILGGLLDSSVLVFTGMRDAVMPILTWFVTSGLPLITSFSDGVLTVFQKIFDVVKYEFDTIWSGAISPGLNLASQMIVDTLDIIKGFWDTFGGDIITGITTNIDWVKKIFTNLWKGFLEPFVTNMLKGMKWLWDNHLKGLIQQITIFIGKLITGVQDINNKFISPIINYLVKKLGPTFSNIFSFIGDVLLTVVGVVADVAKGIFKSLGGIIDFIVGIFTGDWKRAWTGVKDIFGGIFDAVLGILKGAINLIVDGINFLIRQMNKIKIDVPGWLQDLTGAGGSFGVNISEIPKLANGGLVSAPTLAMVGDNKNAASDPEVVSPLSKLQDMLGATNQGMIEVLMMILDAIEKQQMSLEIDGEKLTRVIRNKLRTEDGRVGKNIVTVGGVPVR